MDSFTKRYSRIAPVTALAVLGLVGAGCTSGDSGEDLSGFAPAAQARLLWEEAESKVLWSSVTYDVKAESRDAVWVIDANRGALLRFEPRAHNYRQMGLEDSPPQEIVFPVRLAVDPNLGLFVYDSETRRVDHFTPDGKPIYSFDPGLTPARLDVVRQPIGLQFAAVITGRPDSVPRLAVIRTGLRGLDPDTLLFPGVRGPEILQKAAARSGELALAAGNEALWAWTRTAPDTVYQVTSHPGAAKRSLRPEDTDPVGILVDPERELLWIVSALEEGQLRYAAYDIRAAGVQGPETSFLGERTTAGFDPKTAGYGAVFGLLKPPGKRPRLAAYDMLVPEER